MMLTRLPKNTDHSKLSLEEQAMDHQMEEQNNSSFPGWIKVLVKKEKGVHKVNRTETTNIQAWEMMLDSQKAQIMTQ